VKYPLEVSYRTSDYSIYRKYMVKENLFKSFQILTEKPEELWWSPNEQSSQVRKSKLYEFEFEESWNLNDNKGKFNNSIFCSKL